MDYRGKIRSEPVTPLTKIQRTPSCSSTPGANSKSEKIPVRPLIPREQAMYDLVGWECADERAIVCNNPAGDRSSASYSFDVPILKEEKDPIEEEFSLNLGTTVMVLHLNDWIISVADGRVTQTQKREKYQRVVSGKAQKLSELQDIGGILGISGKKYVAKKALALIKSKSREKGCTPTTLMERVKQEMESKKYRIQVSLGGFWEGLPYLLLLGGDDKTVRDPTAGGGLGLISFGSGGKAAHDHLIKRLDEGAVNSQSTKDDWLEVLMECLAAAALADSSTGGKFLGACVHREGKVKMLPERKHLFSHIAEAYRNLQVWLSPSLVYITTGCLRVDEVKLEEHLRKMLDGILKIHVLGINLKTEKIVRLIMFESVTCRRAGFHSAENSDLDKGLFFFPAAGKKKKEEKEKEAKTKGKILMPTEHLFRDLRREFKKGVY